MLTVMDLIWAYLENKLIPRGYCYMFLFAFYLEMDPERGENRRKQKFCGAWKQSYIWTQILGFSEAVLGPYVISLSYFHRWLLLGYICIRLMSQQTLFSGLYSGFQIILLDFKLVKVCFANSIEKEKVCKGEFAQCLPCMSSTRRGKIMCISYFPTPPFLLSQTQM